MTQKLTRINLQGRFNTKGRFTTKPSMVATVVLAVAAGSAFPAPAQTQHQPPQPPAYQAAGANFEPASTLSLPAMPEPSPITPNGEVVEDAVARINDQIITRTEYAAAEQQLLQEARQDNISQADLDDRVNNLLRDLIDEQLLLSKGKELGITGDAETIRELDDIRKKNNLPSMEALEKAAAQQGVSFEDFKQHIRDQIIRQQVVRDQVGSHLNMTHTEEIAYYNAHAQDFAVPEQVHLSEILIPTPENATQADLDAALAKANEIAGKLRAGANFAALARTDSGGPNAAGGGDLGDWKRGTLGDVLEKATFPLPVGANTDPIRTRQGYVILHVDSHQKAGVPPLADVEGKVQEALYFQQLQPALRAYLTKARSDAYTEIAPGFTDSGAPTKKAPTQIAYTAYKAPPLKKKIKQKQRIEQEKANRAQAELAAARERVAEKEAAHAAKVDEKNGKPVTAVYKPKKIHREKIRYGEAPEQALPNGTAETAVGGSIGAPITGQAPGVAMAPNESITTITTGTGADEDSADPFAPKTGPQKKVRFSSFEAQAEERSAKEHLTKAEAKAETRPLPTTPTENADEKLRAQPLGLNGDTVAKQKKPKHQKGEVKERFEEKPKEPKETPNTVAPTVNPNLATPVPAPPPPPSNPSPTQ
ncbi:MAG TPA: peptidylprolyl isomerase [Acidobacteriaceae bacterium]|nr:peptidylprolyl isomerase [Acidobacteriaceae bacterium]